MKQLVVVFAIASVLAACSFLDENDGPSAPDTNTSPTVSLSASPRSGPAPLTVTLNATATDPEDDNLSYSWSLDGLPDAATAITVLSDPGQYPITVTVSDGSATANATTTVNVTEGSSTDPEPPIDPEPPTDPIDPAPGEGSLEVTASPGGVAPWAVRYDIEATGFPEGSTYEIGCRLVYDNPDTPTIPVDNRIDDDSFACFYAGASGNDDGFVRVLPAGGGEPLAAVTLDPELTGTSEPIFEGLWRYTYSYADGTPTKTGTFTIDQGDSVNGTSADGFSFELYEFRTDVAIAYNDDSSQTASSFLIPDPQADGTQRYLDGITRTDGVTLVLEQLD